MTRRSRILALLWTLHDGLPAPHGSLNPARGLAASERVGCPDCATTDTPGWIAERVRGIVRAPRPCLTCGGKHEPSGKHGQWLKADGGRGWVQVDPMDAERAPVQSADVSARPTKPPRMVTCDACEGTGVGGAHLREPDDPASEYREACRRCQGSGKRAVTVFNLQLDRERNDSDTALEAAIDRRREAGSYHELDQALDTLPRFWRELLLAVHTDRTRPEQTLGMVERYILEAALMVVEALMPQSIRVPPAVKAAVKHADERAGKTLAVGTGAGKTLIDKRDREIRKHARHDRPTQWIAAEYGLSVATVNRIISEAA